MFFRLTNKHNICKRDVYIPVIYISFDKGNNMKADRNSIKTQYMLLVLPSSKKRFQKMKQDEGKTTWQLFDEILDIYDEYKDSKKRSFAPDTA